MAQIPEQVFFDGIPHSHGGCHGSISQIWITPKAEQGVVALMRVTGRTPVKVCDKLLAALDFQSCWDPMETATPSRRTFPKGVGGRAAVPLLVSQSLRSVTSILLLLL